MRVDIKAILADPVKRRKLMTRALQATCNRERGDLPFMTLEEAEAIYDKRAQVPGPNTKIIRDGWCMSCRTRHRATTPHDEEHR